MLAIKDKISGEEKYKNLAVVVKSCLSLAHGNADVERGFSINNSLVTNNRTCLSETSIIAIRHVKDAVRRYGSIHDVPITEKLIKYVAKSHSTYMAAKEAERKAADEIKKKRALEEAEQNNAREAKKLKKEAEEKIKEINNKIKNFQDNLLSAQNCLAEGNERLQKALKIKDFNEMKIASTMIEAATSKVQETTEQLNKTQTKKSKFFF